MEQEQTEVLMPDEDYKDFLRRIFADRPDAEPLRILGILAEIIVIELHGQPYRLSATADAKGLSLTFTHDGDPIDSRMVRVIEESIDETHYHHNRQGHHELTIRRILQRKKVITNQNRI